MVHQSGLERYVRDSNEARCLTDAASFRGIFREKITALVTVCELWADTWPPNKGGFNSERHGGIDKQVKPRDLFLRIALSGFVRPIPSVARFC